MTDAGGWAGRDVAGRARVELSAATTEMAGDERASVEQRTPTLRIPDLGSRATARKDDPAGLPSLLDRSLPDSGLAGPGSPVRRRARRPRSRLEAT
jgi:hypothetical protein